MCNDSLSSARKKARGQLLRIDGLPVYYTNYGPGCNISAPGGEPYTGGQDRDECQVLSTMPTDKIEDYYYEEDDENFENPIPSGEYLPTDYGWM